MKQVWKKVWMKLSSTFLEVQNKKVQAPVTLQPITPTNFVKPASQLSEPIRTRENPIDPVQKEFSFIPFFLRKK